MSRDSGAHGVQVVGGSNPPCPTKSNPIYNNWPFHPLARKGPRCGHTFSAMSS
jgi:hypothetical protein